MLLCLLACAGIGAVTLFDTGTIDFPLTKFKLLEATHGPDCMAGTGNERSGNGEGFVHISRCFKRVKRRSMIVVNLRPMIRSHEEINHGTR
jgi:hypothetical protein